LYNQDSSVSEVTGYSRDKDFSPHSHIQTSCEAHPTSSLVATGGSFAKGEVAGA